VQPIDCPFFDIAAASFGNALQHAVSAISAMTSVLSLTALQDSVKTRGHRGSLEWIL
jgi:hypothetical protein